MDLIVAHAFRYSDCGALALFSSMCDCIEKVNAKLAKRHLELKLHAIIDTTTYQTGRALALETVRTKKGVKPVPVFLEFCPFCGQPFKGSDQKMDTQAEVNDPATERRLVQALAGKAPDEELVFEEPDTLRDNQAQLDWYPVRCGSLALTVGTDVTTDDCNGELVPCGSITGGTLNYVTGEMRVTGVAADSAFTATYRYVCQNP